MSHDLHSLIDQAVERTQSSTVPEPVSSPNPAARARLASWQAELSSFVEEFQHDVAELLSDLSTLTTSAPPVAAVVPERTPVEHRPIEPSSGSAPADDALPVSDQQQDRLSALRERLSKQLQTNPTEMSPSTTPEPGGQS